MRYLDAITWRCGTSPIGDGIFAKVIVPGPGQSGQPAPTEALGDDNRPTDPTDRREPDSTADRPLRPHHSR